MHERSKECSCSCLQVGTKVKELESIVASTNVGEPPETLDTRKKVYSWGYHRMEVMLRRHGDVYTDDDFKMMCRLKGGEVRDRWALHAGE